jgi:hypothetical protein
MKITDTTTDQPTAELALLEDYIGGPGAGITNMEKRGQAELVNSDRLPTSFGPHRDAVAEQAAYEALGFTFGAPDPADPLFRPATLPAGWSRQASDHAMHSYIVDEFGRRRVAIFYKAASYDRRADMRLETPYGYLAAVLYAQAQPTLDTTWLTYDVALATLAEIRDQAIADAVRCDENHEHGYGADGYYAKRADEHRAEASCAQALIDDITALQTKADETRDV